MDVGEIFLPPTRYEIGCQQSVRCDIYTSSCESTYTALSNLLVCKLGYQVIVAWLVFRIQDERLQRIPPTRQGDG